MLLRRLANTPLESFQIAGISAAVPPESRSGCWPERVQPSGGLVKIWPGEIRPAFLFVHAKIARVSKCATDSLYTDLVHSSSHVTGLRHSREVFRPELIALRAELVQILPCVQASIMAVIE